MTSGAPLAPRVATRLTTCSSRSSNGTAVGGQTFDLQGSFRRGRLLAAVHRVYIRVGGAVVARIRVVHRVDVRVGGFDAGLRFVEPREAFGALVSPADDHRCAVQSIALTDANEDGELFIVEEVLGEREGHGRRSAACASE